MWPSGCGFLFALAVVVFLCHSLQEQMRGGHFAAVPGEEGYGSIVAYQNSITAAATLALRHLTDVLDLIHT